MRQWVYVAPAKPKDIRDIGRGRVLSEVVVDFEFYHSRMPPSLYTIKTILVFGGSRVHIGIDTEGQFHVLTWMNAT